MTPYDTGRVIGFAATFALAAAREIGERLTPALFLAAVIFILLVGVKFV